MRIIDDDDFIDMDMADDSFEGIDLGEIICCERCGFEYDRHIDDVCINCGHINVTDINDED